MNVFSKYGHCLMSREDSWITFRSQLWWRNGGCDEIKDMKLSQIKIAVYIFLIGALLLFMGLWWTHKIEKDVWSLGIAICNILIAIVSVIFWKLEKSK